MTVMHYNCTSSDGIRDEISDIELLDITSDIETSSITSIKKELKYAYESYLKGDYNAVIEIYKKVATEYMKYDFTQNLAVLYSSIGFILLKIGRYEESKTYIELSLELGNKYIKSDKQKLKLQAVNNNKLAHLYIVLNQLEKAKEYNDKSFEVNKIISKVIGVSRNLRIYGLYYYKKGVLDNALKSFKDALILNEIANDYYEALLNRISLSSILLLKKEFANCLKNLTTGLKIAKIKEIPEKVGNILFKIGEVYEVKGNLQTALYYYRRAYESTVNLEPETELYNIILQKRIIKYVKKVEEIYTKLNRAEEFPAYKRGIDFIRNLSNPSMR